jgi:2-succinyl-5-enolpyruvyl-6-hydroxy-3-cyclohexene-1-carboxylate synthase
MPDSNELDWSPETPAKNSAEVKNQKSSTLVPLELDVATNGIFVLGDNADAEAVQEIAKLATQLAWPIIWEPSANAHSLTNSISHGVLLLQAGVAPQPDV